MQNAFVVVATTETFWQFLTNLTYIVIMVTYIALSILHFQKGDYKLCQKPSRDSSYSDDDEVREELPVCCEAKCWKLLTLLYELSLSLILLVFIAFWFIELPAVFNSKRHYIMQLPEYIGFFYAHTFPEIFTALEFFNSTVRIEWRRFWIYALVGLIVLVMNIVVSYVDVNPYAALDWGEKNHIAIPVAISMFVIQAITYFMLIKVR